MTKLDPTIDDFSLRDDGTLDTVIVGPNGLEMRYSTDFAADYRDPMTGELDFDLFITEVVMDDCADGECIF